MVLLRLASTAKLVSLHVLLVGWGGVAASGDINEKGRLTGRRLTRCGLRLGRITTLLPMQVATEVVRSSEQELDDEVPGSESGCDDELDEEDEEHTELPRAGCCSLGRKVQPVSSSSSDEYSVVECL